jgi:hypothetical protein
MLSFQTRTDPDPETSTASGRRAFARRLRGISDRVASTIERYWWIAG